MAIAVRDLEAGDQARIAEVDGGPAWNSNPLLWERYLEEQNRGERDVLLAVRGDAILAYGSLICISTYPPFKGEGIPKSTIWSLLPPSAGRGVPLSSSRHWNYGRDWRAGR